MTSKTQWSSNLLIGPAQVCPLVGVLNLLDLGFLPLNLSDDPCGFELTTRLGGGRRWDRRPLLICGTGGPHAHP